MIHCQSVQQVQDMYRTATHSGDGKYWHIYFHESLSKVFKDEIDCQHANRLPPDLQSHIQMKAFASEIM